MSVFDLFRRFFHPPGVRDPFFGGMTLDDEDDDEGEEFEVGGGLYHGPSPDPGFHSPFWLYRGPSRDPFGFEDMFRDFNELFADFGSVIRDSQRFPGIEMPRSHLEEPRGGALRDFMLKYPDSHLPRERAPPNQPPEMPNTPRQPHWPPLWHRDSLPSEESRQDKALDSEVSSHGLDSVLRPREPTSSSFFRSVSVSKVIRPDGTVEERRTERDGQGNTTTTVTVTRGDEVSSSSSGSPASPLDAIIDRQGHAPSLPSPLPDLSDSQSILSRILQLWFSGR